MDVSPAAHRPADAVRETPASGRWARPELLGDARPGDVLALPGGTVVRDDNVNGFVDGADAVVRTSSLPHPALHIDVRA
jgi:hypothetical protein